MSVHRYQVSAAADTLLPRDRLVNNVYLNHTVPGVIAPTDIEAVCNDLADVFAANWYGGGDSREITVRAYEIGTPPNFPVASVTKGTGLAPASAVPREVALCLSFYSGRNLPRRRGRIYLPMAGHSSAVGLRPAAGVRTAALDLGTAIANVGGVDVDWSVYSQRDGAPFAISHMWVDDEWDTVRSRGLKATTRDARDLSE